MKIEDLKVGNMIEDRGDIAKVIYINLNENYIVVEEKYTNFPFAENVLYYRLFVDELSDWRMKNE
jgi:hypothetical protein